MSKKKSSKSIESVESVESRVEEQTSIWRSLEKMERIFAVGLMTLLVASVFGFAFSKDESRRMKDETSANALTPNAHTSNALNPVTTTATLVLSKEYIYAGSRLLNVSDAGAEAAPPADLAVWRPSNGTFYVLGGPNSTQTFAQWGTSGDIPVPGDFDGDGKTDFSIYRPSDGFWWIVKSSSPSESISLQFGAECTQPAPNNCDKVAPADYDGDGKTDAAVYRPAPNGVGTWYILQSGSGNSFYSQQFGLATDLPAPADYDGDGRADIGVWRDSNKTFYSSNSSNGQLAVGSFQTAVSTSNNTQVSGDYDGDGRADYAVRSGNNWIIKNSSNNQTQTIAWQTAGDIAVQNDYDGDGKVDIATWNNTTGIWSIRQSGSNNTTRTVQWGTTNDIPVPAYYRR